MLPRCCCSKFPSHLILLTMRLPAAVPRAVLAAALALTLSGHAVTFTVTNNATSGAGSLRQAIFDAGENGPGADDIHFDAALSGQTIALVMEIYLGCSVTIDASSLTAGLTIQGGGPADQRIFYVPVGETVSLIGLTLTGGKGDGVQAGPGGAIHNRGTLTLTRCTLSGNAGNAGGALYNGGTATVDACTFVGNAGLFGGGIATSGSGAITVTRSTFSGNTAVGGGGAVFGGGDLEDSGTALENCTIVGNSVSSPTATGGGVSGGTSMVVKNCIIAGNTGGVAGQENLVTGILQAGVNLTAGDPLLGPLGNYGGSTQTRPPLPGSPAINAAVGSPFTTDQRGFPIVGTPDIGAYEAGNFSNFTTWSWETAGSVLSFGGDAEQDGATNGLEYALRRDPLASDAPLSPTLAPGGPGSHLFQFRYRKNASDLRYIVQRSTDLGQAAGWTEIYRYDLSTGAITETGVTGDENAATELITLSDPTGGTKLFWRLQIEQVP